MGEIDVPEGAGFLGQGQQLAEDPRGPSSRARPIDDPAAGDVVRQGDPRHAMEHALPDGGDRPRMKDIRAEVATGVDAREDPVDPRREVIERQADAIGRRARNGHAVLAHGVIAIGGMGRHLCPHPETGPIGATSRQRPSPSAACLVRGQARRIPAVVVGQEKRRFGSTQRGSPQSANIDVPRASRACADAFPSAGSRPSLLDCGRPTLRMSKSSRTMIQSSLQIRHNPLAGLIPVAKPLGT